MAQNTVSPFIAGASGTFAPSDTSTYRVLGASSWTGQTTNGASCDRWIDVYNDNSSTVEIVVGRVAVNGALSGTVKAKKLLASEGQTFFVPKGYDLTISASTSGATVNAFEHLLP